MGKYVVKLNILNDTHTHIQSMKTIIDGLEKKNKVRKMALSDFSTF